MRFTKWPGHDPYKAIYCFQDHWRGKGCEVMRSLDSAFLKFAEGMFNARAAKSRRGA
jgi:hypothetical protein